MKAGRGFRCGLGWLCLAACAAYGLNRWVVKPCAEPGFHLNDVLLIPAALPWVLWLQRVLRLRAGDGPPAAGEVFLHTAVWALIAEWAGPALTGWGTADWGDVAAYCAGAAAGYVLWRGKKPLARGGQHP